MSGSPASASAPGSGPAPSAVPPRSGDDSSRQDKNTRLEPDAGPIPGFRQPILRVELRDVRHPATAHFLRNFDVANDMEQLVFTVVNILYRPRHADRSLSMSHIPRSVRDQRKGSWQTIGSDGEDESDEGEQDGKQQDQGANDEPGIDKEPGRTIPHDLNIPQTRSVTLVIREMGGVAYTTGLELDDAHKEIHFAFDHITNAVNDSNHDQAAIRHELLGVVCHELVHCYQNYAPGSNVPGGLVEGIADWVRLHAGYVPKHWRKETGDKVRWDAGYQTTGYFLDWLDDTYGEGSVRKINQRLMRLEKYNEKAFWNDQFGKSVRELWMDYSAAEFKRSET